MDWNVYGLRGARDKVKEQVKANAMLPHFVKDYILEEIDALPGDCVGVAVDAYGQTHDPKALRAEAEKQGVKVPHAGHNVTRAVHVTVVGIRF